MATKVGTYSGRAAGSNWFKVSGTIQMNGTTVVSDTFNLPHHAERGVLSLKAIGGTATNTYTVTLYNEDFFDTDNPGGSVVNEVLVAIGASDPAGETSKILLVGEGVTTLYAGYVIPAGNYVFEAKSNAADTGILAWEMVFKLG